MPQPGEPLWTEEDRAWALALAQVEADTCPDCGQPWSEVSTIDAEFAYDAELLRCHACATGARAAHRYQEAGGDPRGIHVSIVKR
ncbi:hypothetical protein ACH4GK_17935 [Streptomyces rimosus]|uniref:hypothetical protein n=1 Tax=Streptomyces rimosus TaxID=1927 RepID=UPI0004C74A2D|nr:hypothetical protein [Streptomyces rimosus]